MLDAIALAPLDSDFTGLWTEPALNATLAAQTLPSAHNPGQAIAPLLPPFVGPPEDLHVDLHVSDPSQIVDYDYGADTWISGQEGDDSLTGNANRDLISGLGGNDWLNGGAGDDGLWGDQGDDTLIGGAGDDYLAGGGGAAIIEGGEGDDIIDIGTG